MLPWLIDSRRKYPASIQDDLGPADPYFAFVSALLHFNGVDGSTSIVDVMGKSWTAIGDADITIDHYKFGGAAGDLNGSDKYITTPLHADFGFEDDDFTVEGWNWYLVGSDNQCIFDNRSGSDTGIGIYVAHPSGGYLNVVSNTALLVIASTAFTPSTWQHWAVTREAGELRIFVDGILVGTVTDARTYASSAAVTLGDNYIAPSQPSLSIIDDFRITKGVARYTANFTPPAAPFPNH